MFGSSGSPTKEDSEAAGDGKDSPPALAPIAANSGLNAAPLSLTKSNDETISGEKRAGQSPARASDAIPGEKKRRSSGVASKASSLLASAKNSLNFSPSPNSSSFRLLDNNNQTPLQKLGKHDPALSVPQGQYNNSAGESFPGPRSTFRVGVWEDRNKKCRRTMEDTHAFLYNFLHTPAPAIRSDTESKREGSTKSKDELTKTSTRESTKDSHRDSSSSIAVTTASNEMMETDNGYFAIFDGHAGTFAADWCGKKLHIILEEMIRKNPNTPIPELLDQTFTSVDRQLEKLPLKNSGCTAVTAVLRWEDRIPNTQSATGSTAMAPATIAAVKAAEEAAKSEGKGEGGFDATRKPSDQPSPTASTPPSVLGESTHAELKKTATRQRVLYTANVGDARIVLCRGGKALRLSYDHKGSDENEGKRVANAGGLILNNRVNGVLAVTRALGDAYMKDLVTGHPYTTETVIQPDVDEFIILACDGLWDVCSDQEAVDLVRNIPDPVQASKILVDHALARFSTDNLSCMIVRFNKSALLDTYNNKSEPIGVEGDPSSTPGKMSEVDKILDDAKRKVAEEGPSMGVSGSNSGKGHDPEELEVFRQRKDMEKVVEEEPTPVEGVQPEMKVDGAKDISPDAKATPDTGIPEEAPSPTTTTSVEDKAEPKAELKAEEK